MDIFETWSEFGLAGLVIFSLFTLLYRLIRDLNRKDREHTENINKLIEDERVERKDARADNKESHANLASAIERMADQLGGK